MNENPNSKSILEKISSQNVSVDALIKFLNQDRNIIHDFIQDYNDLFVEL